MEDTPATSTMSPGTMSRARILCTPGRSKRITLPISGSYSFRASMALSALRSYRTRGRLWFVLAGPSRPPPCSDILGAWNGAGCRRTCRTLVPGRGHTQWRRDRRAQPHPRASYLPYAHNCIGHKDQHDDQGLHKGCRGLLTLLKPGQDLPGSELVSLDHTMGQGLLTTSFVPWISCLLPCFGRDTTGEP